MLIIEDVIGVECGFDAALLTSLYRGLNPSQAIKYVSIVGALVVTVGGDREAQPTWEALEPMLEYLREI